MTLNELIEKLTEMKRYVSGYAEVSIFNNSLEQYSDWLKIERVNCYQRTLEDPDLDDMIVIDVNEE